MLFAIVGVGVSTAARRITDDGTGRHSRAVIFLILRLVRAYSSAVLSHPRIPSEPGRFPRNGAQDVRSVGAEAESAPC